MKIVTSKNYHNLEINQIEKRYDVKYIGDFCIKDKNNNWTDFPVSIFYQNNPDISKGHSNYLGVYRSYENIFLIDGKSAFEENLKGIKYKNKIYISCYRHHYVSNKDNNFMIDGGRDYLRCSGGEGLVTLKMIEGKFKIVE